MRAPYHYTAACDEVVVLGRAWFAWLTEGKSAFLKIMAAQDDEHKALLDRHNERKQRHGLATKEVKPTEWCGQAGNVLIEDYFLSLSPRLSLHTLTFLLLSFPF